MRASTVDRVAAAPLGWWGCRGGSGGYCAGHNSSVEEMMVEGETGYVGGRLRPCASIKSKVSNKSAR